MQQSDMSSSSHFQYYQSHFQNPNPSPPSNPSNSHFNPLPTTYASAPPVSSNYSSSDYFSYSSTYPSYSQSTDHAPNPSPPYPPNPNSHSSDFSHEPYSFPHLASLPAPYYSYDQNLSALNYDHSNSNYDSNPNSLASCRSLTVPNYENLYGSSENFGRYVDIGEPRPRPENGLRYDHSGFPADEGVYAYSGGKVEPYGAQGSRSESSTGLSFDDYGRPINFSNGKEQSGSGTFPKIVKAIPKTETQHDVKSGVQKFRVKLLSEGGGQSDMDVLCQIGLDGIRILDPATSRTLKIYPLEIVTRWEVLDSYIFAFWAKSSVDFEPRCIRLKSNSYTTNNILDMVTAATIQFKEMDGSNRTSDPPNTSEQSSEKKKGFADWINLMKPGSEEKDHWVPDEAVAKCTACGTDFGAFVRRHHCRNCGDIFCDKCTQGRIALTADEHAQPVRVCDRCMAEVTQRLSNAKEVAGKAAGLQSHEDFAKRLQEVMDKNRKTSTGNKTIIGLKSDEFGMRMREVACPTCTVHLQVQVPASGSETIECSVCQHPFLVNAN